MNRACWHWPSYTDGSLWWFGLKACSAVIWHFAGISAGPNPVRPLNSRCPETCGIVRFWSTSLCRRHPVSRFMQVNRRCRTSNPCHASHRVWEGVDVVELAQTPGGHRWLPARGAPCTCPGIHLPGKTKCHLQSYALLGTKWLEMNEVSIPVCSGGDRHAPALWINIYTIWIPNTKINCSTYILLSNTSLLFKTVSCLPFYSKFTWARAWAKKPGSRLAVA